MNNLSERGRAITATGHPPMGKHVGEFKRFCSAVIFLVHQEGEIICLPAEPVVVPLVLPFQAVQHAAHLHNKEMLFHSSFGKKESRREEQKLFAFLSDW
jgi:hypothetical protein